MWSPLAGFECLVLPRSAKGCLWDGVGGINQKQEGMKEEWEKDMCLSHKTPQLLFPVFSPSQLLTESSQGSTAGPNSK